MPLNNRVAMLRSVFMFLLCFLGSPAKAQEFEEPRLVQGVLDLRDWNPKKVPTFALQGEIEFHWQNFLKTGEESLESQEFQRFPSYWNIASSYPYHGYGTYRIQVKMKKAAPISLRFIPPWTAAQYFIDGKLVYTMGRVGTTAETSRPGRLRSWIYSFTPASEQFEIIVHVSNFDLYAGGFGSGIQIGSFSAIQETHDKVTALGLFLMGAIAVMGVYHIAIFGLRRTDRSALYYGVFCLMIAMHLSVADPSNPLRFMINASFETSIRFYNIGWMMGTASFMLFTRNLFPQEYSLRVAQLVALISVLHSSFVLVAPVRDFIFSTLFYQAVTGISSLYTMYVVFRAARNKREGAKTFLTASLALFVGATHDMAMLQGLFNSVPIGSAGALLFTCGQSYLLSMRFSKAFQRAETSEAEVRRLVDDLKTERDNVLVLNHTLEDRVEMQTRDIHSIMEHIQLGIFTIEGEKQTIHKDYSRHLERLFEAENLAGKVALPLLFEGSSLAANDRDQVVSTLNSTLGQSEINFFTNEHMLPHTISRKRSDGQMRQFELGWNPIIRNGDEVEKILVTVNDATDIRKLESIAREKAEDLTIIGEILSCKEDMFRRFLRNCREFNAQNRLLISNADPLHCDREVLKIIFMNMHTMKGAARTLQFKKLTEIFHDLEQYYSNLARDDEATWDLELMKRDVDMIEEVTTHYEALARDRLGRALDGGAQVNLPFEESLSTFQNLETFLGLRNPSTVLLAPLYGLLQNALFNRLEIVITDILSSTQALAKDLIKPAPSLDLKIPDLWVSNRAEDLLRNTFVHLLRNSMDHGIEFPAERLGLGKKAEGIIHLSVEVLPRFMRLYLADDGKGLNLRRLQKLGRERNLLPLDRDASREEIAEIIFAAGISTAQSLTEISGRGVGMSAVRKYYQDVGGDISVVFDDSRHTQEGFAAFLFCIDLPLKLFSQTRHLAQSKDFTVA